MRNEEIRQPEISLYLFQQVQHLRLNRGVEGRHGLITDDKLRAGHQRPCNGHTLPLAAGKLVRVTSGMSGLQPHAGARISPTRS